MQEEQDQSFSNCSGIPNRWKSSKKKSLRRLRPTRGVSASSTNCLGRAFSPIRRRPPSRLAVAVESSSCNDKDKGGVCVEEDDDYNDDYNDFDQDNKLEYNQSIPVVTNIFDMNILSDGNPIRGLSKANKLMDNLTIYLIVSLNQAEKEKVAFCVGGANEDGEIGSEDGNENENENENECKKVIMTNNDLLKMLNAGKQFRPTVISKESKEALHGLWMQVTSETKLDDIEIMRKNQISSKGSDVSFIKESLIYEKHAFLTAISILTGAAIALFSTKDSLLYDLFLSSTRSILYLKIIIWIVLAAFLSVVLNVFDILASKTNTDILDSTVELKVVLEKWSSEKVQSRISSSVSEITLSQYGRMSHNDQQIKSISSINSQPKKNLNQIFSRSLGVTTNININNEDDVTPSPSIVSENQGSQTNKLGEAERELGIDYPIRFYHAAKCDPVLGRKRYEATVAWRKKERMDTIMDEPFIYYDLVKKNYPHYYHLRGKNNEPVYYECPPKMNLKLLKKAGMTLEHLLRYYALVTEYTWSVIEPSEEGKSIYVIDLDTMRILDFVGDVIDFIKKTSHFTAEHYPERSGTIFVVNVPSWFNIIWKVVSPMTDEVTRKKIRILRGKENILKDLLTRIDLENIPSDYGGTSMALGQSPEEKKFAQKMKKNLERANLKAVTVP